MIVELGGADLTVAAIAALADRESPGRLGPQARAAAAASHRFATNVTRERPVYGRSTGVGANRDVPIEDPAAHAAGLLASHASTAGRPRADRRVRAMLAVRLNQLAAGGSGASPQLLDAVEALLAADELPVVGEYGSVGTGDLGALATVARSLPLAVGDALPFLSSNAGAIGDAALAVVDLRQLAAVALVVAAWTFDAVDGNAEAFAPAVERATPFPGAREVCSALRARTAGRAARRIQDPFALRCLPQVHGAYLDALRHLEGVVEAYANAPAENPLFLPDLGVAHHGGFHASYLAQALDAARSAAAQAAAASTARLALLVEPAYTGLPAFLGDGTPGASGVMTLEYVAASALGELRALAAPAALQSVTLSRGTEDDASYASLAARQALDAVGPYRVVVACELVAAVRALRMRGLPAPADLPDGDLADRDLTLDVAVAAKWLSPKSRL